MVVDCAHAAWPTPRQVARYTGSGVFDDAHGAWQRMLHDGRRACRHGATQVRLVFLAEDMPVETAARDDTSLPERPD